MSRILHISDIHCDSPQEFGTQRQIVDAIAAANGNQEITAAVIAGDFTYQGSGSGFNRARELLNNLFARQGLSSDRIILCPGNHDLVMREIPRGLHAYERFSSELLRDGSCSFVARPNLRKVIGTLDFWVLNSVYSQDHRYGLVNIRDLRTQLEAAEFIPEARRICVVHHHIINQFQRDISVLRNAYNLLELLDRHHFQLILHGHQHSMQKMSLGTSTLLCYGGRPLSFRGDGANCGFAIIDISQDDQQFQVKDYLFDRSGEHLVARLVQA